MPEPASLLVLAAGTLGISFARRRRQRLSAC
ncbi:PEP-CTERM sorting domain-containing protein [Acidisphaera sp. L21]